MVGPMSIRQLKKQGPFSAALQGRTEYGPRVCVDKARARCRRDIGHSWRREPQTFQYLGFGFFLTGLRGG